MSLIYCTDCGHRVSTNAPSCPRCAAPPFASTDEVSQNQLKFCSKCGVRGLRDHAFCYSCGAPGITATAKIKADTSEVSGIETRPGIVAAAPVGISTIPPAVPMKPCPFCGEQIVTKRNSLSFLQFRSISTAAATRWGCCHGTLRTGGRRSTIHRHSECSESSAPTLNVCTA
jgi:hypothetical protein